MHRRALDVHLHDVAQLGTGVRSDCSSTWSISALPLATVSRMRLKSETLRVNGRSLLFTIIIDSLVCTSSLGSVDRVAARLNGTFPTVGDQHLVTNIRIFPMITESASAHFRILCFMKSSLCAMDSSGRATFSPGNRVRIALPKKAQ